METSEKNINDNHKVVKGVDHRVVTLDDLLEAVNPDLEIWEVADWDVNKYESYRKDIQRSIRWEDGKIVEGYIEDEGKVTVEPMWQIEASFIRKEPIMLHPHIQPVQLPELPTQEPIERALGSLRTSWMIVSDLPMGYHRVDQEPDLVALHDEQVLNLILQVWSSYQFEGIILNGDILDMTDASTNFVESPEFAQTTQPAINRLAQFLYELRVQQPHAQIIYIEGNHEERLTRNLHSHFSWAAGLKPALDRDGPPLMSYQRLLSLDELDVQYIEGYPDAHYWLVPDELKVMHGKRMSSVSGHTTSLLAREHPYSTIIGHIHRNEMAVVTHHYGSGIEEVESHSFGCGCRLDGEVPGIKGEQNWQQGFGTVEIFGDGIGGGWIVQHHLIRTGRVIYDGDEFIA